MPDPSSTSRARGRRGHYFWPMVALALAGCGASTGPDRSLSGVCRYDGYLAHLCRSPDSDGDGLPDDVEDLFGTDPGRADTDLDGLGDAEDPCPLLRGGSPRGVDGEVRQAAVRYLLRDIDRVILAIPEGEERLCYRGVPGPQLHGRSVPWEYAVLLFHGISAPSTVAEGATAVIEVSLVGQVSGCAWRLTLVRREERWRVEEAHPTLCS